MVAVLSSAREYDSHVNDNVRYWIATAPVGAASVLAEELAQFGAPGCS